MNSDTPLKVRWLPDSQDLQNIRVTALLNCRTLICAGFTYAYDLRLAARRVF
jgi:hypothetical protein